MQVKNHRWFLNFLLIFFFNLLLYFFSGYDYIYQVIFPFVYFLKKEKKPWDCIKNYSDAPAEWLTTQIVAWPVGEYQIQFYFDIGFFHNSTMFQSGNTQILFLVFVFLCEVYFGFCILDPSSKGRKSMVRLTCIDFSWFSTFTFFGDLHKYT